MYVAHGCGSRAGRHGQEHSCRQRGARELRARAREADPFWAVAAVVDTQDAAAMPSPMRLIEFLDNGTDVNLCVDRKEREERGRLEQPTETETVVCVCVSVSE
jgi:hypothetical protein